MFRTALLTVLSVAMLAVTTTQTDAAAKRDDFRLRARMSGNTLVSGKADYRERTRDNTLEQRFSVEVEDAAPGETFEVRVNGALFGTITADDLGVAELQFRTAQFIDDPGDGTPIPTDFPRLAAGDMITVGPVSGAFEER